MARYVLEDFGSFHVGGRAVTASGLAPRMLSYTPASPPSPKDPNGRYWIEQAYVQYFIPAGGGERLPLVLLHGGGLTGVTWDKTPDGRDGWLHQFLEAGHAVYVVDQPERGRAGFSVVPGTWDGEPISRPLEEAWTLFRFGLPEGFASRSPFEGCDFPIAELDAFAMQFVPRWTTTRAIHLAAFREVVARVGRCIVVCHSQGGDAAHVVAAERPDLIAGVVALEPSGFSPDPLPSDLTGQRYLYIYGAHIMAHEMWAALDVVARENVARLTAAGADVTWVDLAERGIAGATHMMMMDRSSARTASLVSDWIAARA